MKGRSLARGAGILAALFVLVGTILLSTAGIQGNEVPGSVGNAERDGRRVAFFMLAELGFEPEAWDRRPGTLPRGAHVLFLPRVPDDGAVREDRALEEAEAGEDFEVGQEAGAGEPNAPTEPDALDLAWAGGMRGPRHYRRFLEQGGRIVVAVSEELLEFLRADLELDAFAQAELSELGEVEPRIELFGAPTGESFRSLLEDPLGLQGLSASTISETLAETEGGEPFVVEVPVGRGGLVLVADDGFLENESIKRVDHARMFVRLMEGLDRGGRVLFDESALGLGRSESPLGLAFSADMRFLSGHALALALLFVWFLAWPREFPRDPAPHASVAPVARVRAQASLALRARQVGVLASLLRVATLRNLLRRGRLSTQTGEQPEQGLERWLAQRTDLPRAHVARARELFESREVRTREDLVQLDTDLRAFEADAAHVRDREFTETPTRSS